MKDGTASYKHGHRRPQTLTRDAGNAFSASPSLPEVRKIDPIVGASVGERASLARVFNAAKNPRILLNHNNACAKFCVVHFQIRTLPSVNG